MEMRMTRVDDDFYREELECDRCDGTGIDPDGPRATRAKRTACNKCLGGKKLVHFHRKTEVVAKQDG